MKNLLTMIILAAMAGAAAAQTPGSGAFSDLLASAGPVEIVLPEAKASPALDPYETLKKAFDEGSRPGLAGLMGGVAGRAVYPSKPAEAAGVLLACGVENNGPLLAPATKCVLRGGGGTRPDEFDTLSSDQVRITREMLTGNKAYQVTEGSGEVILRRETIDIVFTIYLRTSGGYLTAKHTFVDPDGKEIIKPAYSYYFKKIAGLK